MKNFILKQGRILTAINLVLLLSSCQNSHFKSASKPSSDSDDQSTTIISSYSGGQVTLKDVNFEIEKLVAKNEKLKGLTFDKLNQEQKETLIKEVIIKEIAFKEAKKRKLDRDKDYQEALRNFELELLRQKLIFEIAKEASDEINVKKNYDELVAKLKDKKDIRISYIAVKNLKEAEAIYQILVKYPNSFALQAKRKSLDLEIAKKGGDLGFVMEDSLPSEIVKQIKTINKGQLSKPLQLSNGKWAIIKFVDERPAEILPYEKVKDVLTQNIAKKAIEDFVSQSLKKAKMSILIKE
jgi:parvulin-like peptidyl-prolyl isomerase